MNELALFAGAGGGILGGKLLGWKTVCAVEINTFCVRRLMQRQNEGHLPSFPIWDDVCIFDGRPWRGIVDVVSGGFPCQDISTAGKGIGIKGKRSGLWEQMARIICEVRPKYTFLENSPALTIRGLGKVLGDLAKMGFDAKWGVFSAGDVGARHERARIWILANSNGIRWPELGKQFLQSPQPGKKWHETFGDPSDAPRASNVVANRLDRLSASGNGQVPAVVKLAWDVLSGK